MRILHLALEDRRRPGSGGGALRNHEVNRRLVAAGHQVEMVCARYPGARTRVDDGVLYRHVGVGREYFTSLLSYQAALPLVVARAARSGSDRPDLIVEEFAPPWSSLGVPRWSSIPTVGMVQGYFAAEKARQYHLPERLFVAQEERGTRAHRRLIAVSEDLATRLRGVAPEAHVDVIGLGLDQDPPNAAFAAAAGASVVPRQIVFLGRLEVDQKGLDLLVEACSSLLEEEDAQLVLAGDGRGRRAVERLVQDAGITGRTTLLGRVEGQAKWDLLARATVGVVPSRYETFGLSALESMACGTPVVGFSIDSLRDTVPAAAGVLVQPFDVPALRDALRALLRDAPRRAAMGDAGRAVAATHTWGAVARAQIDAYTEACR